MGKLLYLVGTYLLSDALKRVLLGAGIGLVSSQIILTIVHAALDKMQNAMTGITGPAAAFLSLSGADVAMSVIAAALLTRAAFEASKIGIRKMTA